MDNLNGVMVSIERISDAPYKTKFSPIEASKIANNVKYLPTSWINKDGNNLNDEAFNYFSPLIGDTPTLNFEINYQSLKLSQYKYEPKRRDLHCKSLFL